MDLLLVRFLLASMASMAVGLAVWSLCAVLRRLLPALASQRMGWLLAQLTVAAVFLLTLAPQPQRQRLVPPVDIEAVDAAVTRYLAPAVRTPAIPAPVSAGAARQDITASWLVACAQGWLLFYLLGLGWQIGKFWRAQRLLAGLAAGGVPLGAGEAGGRFNAVAPTGTVAGMCAGVPVIEVDAPVPPMLLGPYKPRLLLPRHLRAFDPLQQRLIVEHELTHWRRRDLHWMLAGVVLQTLLWFNPFMRWLRASLLWAQELGCDRDVLRGRPVQERKAYAAALVAQLKWQCHPGATTTSAALAFGGVSTETVKARIGLIRAPANPATTMRVRCAAIAVLAVAAGGGYALQPALAWQGAGAPSGLVQCLALTDAATGQPLLRQGQCDARVTPASTFNIVVSLMGYDSGMLKDEATPRLPFRAGYPDWNDAWRATTGPAEWIRNSTLWYAQQVALQVGAPAFQRYLDRFDYGNRDAAGDAGASNGLTMSWVNSSLKISADEQLAFLRRLVNRDLGLAPQAYDMTSRLLKVRTLPNGWVVYGKTGTGSPVGTDGKDDRDHAYGWFVGWAVKGDRTVVFARLNQDRQAHEDAAGPRARDALLRELPAQLDAL
uniref:Putative response regulator n=1 Tax=uncultured bacterium BLR18 TaxID=506518 RepID=B5L5W1_9BACT|nr:putative response regulator [uncultured bacterium BLR18]